MLKFELYLICLSKKSFFSDSVNYCSNFKFSNRNTINSEATYFLGSLLQTNIQIDNLQQLLYFPNKVLLQKKQKIDSLSNKNILQILPMHTQVNYIKEIQKEGSVKSHFEKYQELYSADINLAIYMDLSDVQKLHIFDIISVNDKQNFLINFYGFRMKLDDHLNQKLYKLFIRQMDTLLRNESKRKYSVIVFDSSSENKNCFDQFRQMYKRLPAVYFVKLNKIYHVEPGFLTKSLAFIQFTSWSKMFHKHVEYIQNIQNVQQINALKIFNVLAKCPKQITKGIKIKEQTPNMVRSAFVGTRRPKPFYSLKRQLKDYQMDKVREVPLILSILIQTMKQSRQLPMIEGIFRIAASIQDQEQLLKDIIDYKTFTLIDTEKYPKRAIAGLMKKIFTQASTPLIPYPVYNHILNQKVDETNILSFWKIVINELPKLNRQILCYVTQFLRDFILKNKQHNKMNSHNLGVVFNPCFFRGKQCSLADLMHSGKFAAFFKYWLQHYDQVINSTNTQQQNLEEYMIFNSAINRKNIQNITNKGGIQAQDLKMFE